MFWWSIVSHTANAKHPLYLLLAKYYFCYECGLFGEDLELS